MTEQPLAKRSALEVLVGRLRAFWRAYRSSARQAARRRNYELCCKVQRTAEEARAWHTLRVGPMRRR